MPSGKGGNSISPNRLQGHENVRLAFGMADMGAHKISHRNVD